VGLNRDFTSIFSSPLLRFGNKAGVVFPQLFGCFVVEGVVRVEGIAFLVEHCENRIHKRIHLYSRTPASTITKSLVNLEIVMANTTLDCDIWVPELSQKTNFWGLIWVIGDIGEIKLNSKSTTSINSRVGGIVNNKFFIFSGSNITILGSIWELENAIIR
jgi:hypothetical protein